MLELLHHPGRDYDASSRFTGPGPAPSRALVERIAATYREEGAPRAGYGASIWEGIDHRRGRAHDVLLHGSTDEIAAMLQAPSPSNILFGFENTFAEYVAALRGDVDRRRVEARWIHDALARLAEALAAVPLSGPEAPHLEATRSVAALIAAIERRHGGELRFPNPFLDEFGIDTERGTASLRAVHALYQAFRVRSLLSWIGGGTVLEIGAGLGRTAYYCAAMFGIAYVIHDLPLTNVAQAYFLGTLLGEDRVCLGRERHDPARHLVRISSVNQPLGADQRCDLVLNVDSLTEIDERVAAGYVDFVATRASAFVSINHEGQAFRVADLLSRAGLSAQRFPYWMRKGYAEEVWLRRRDASAAFDGSR